MGIGKRKAEGERSYQDALPGQKLSAREKQIARLYMLDWSKQAIAAELGISSHTVHTFLARVYVKLDIHSQLQLVAKGLPGEIERVEAWRRAVLDRE